MDEGEISEKDLLIKSFKMEHGVPCLAYTVEEKQKVKVDMVKLKKLGVI